MRISDWSSDVCSSDLASAVPIAPTEMPSTPAGLPANEFVPQGRDAMSIAFFSTPGIARLYSGVTNSTASAASTSFFSRAGSRSEEHTSELQSLMRISYAVFCLKKKKTQNKHKHKSTENVT